MCTSIRGWKRKEPYLKVLGQKCQELYLSVWRASVIIHLFYKVFLFRLYKQK